MAFCLCQGSESGSDSSPSQGFDQPLRGWFWCPRLTIFLRFLWR